LSMMASFLCLWAFVSICLLWGNCLSGCMLSQMHGTGSVYQCLSTVASLLCLWTFVWVSACCEEVVCQLLHAFTNAWRGLCWPMLEHSGKLLLLLNFSISLQWGSSVVLAFIAWTYYKWACFLSICCVMIPYCILMLLV
jgi:hypothetical protein